MAGDEHHPSPPKLLDHAEAVIEHHRQADDEHDAFESAVVELIRRFNLDYLSAGSNADHRLCTYDPDFGGPYVLVERNGDHHRIPFDPPGDRSS